MEADMEPVAGPSRVLLLPLESGEELEVNLDDFDDSDESLGELKNILTEEQSGPEIWTRAIAEYWRRYPAAAALKVAQWGLECVRAKRRPELEIPLLCQLANYNLALARTAPSLIIKEARADKLDPGTITKSQYYRAALELFAAACQIDPKHLLVQSAQCAVYLGGNQLDEASKSAEAILDLHPTHLFAQMCKARILCAKRQHRAALKIYQNVLTLAPRSLPDPRIGIGICYFHLGERELARKAWQRSIAVHPGRDSLGASVLLGLMHLNAGRDPARPEDVRADEYAKGIKLLQDAFTRDKAMAMAASGLAGHFLTTQSWERAIKLGERAIQYADSRAALSEGQLVVARALHAQGKLPEAAPFYNRSCEKTSEQLVATIASAQIYVMQGPSNYPNAVNAFENILRQHPSSIEALVNLAAVHTHSAFDPNATDRDKERKRAMDLYEQIMRIIAPRLLDPKASSLVNGHDEMDSNASARVREVGSDPDLYVEIARLWADTDPGRALRALRESARLRAEQVATVADAEDKTPATIYGNIGCLEHAQGNFEEAQARFEDALAAAAKGEYKTQTARDAILTTLLYNLGIASEAVGESDKAVGFYEQQILGRHPEFIEAKGRLALIYLRRREYEKAHDLLKQALTADPKHKEIRALYTYFLLETRDLKTLSNFTTATLKEFHKHDVYAMCALGILQYQKARENKVNSKEAAQDRAQRYIRAAEFFSQSLGADPQCAVAAQGIAIALAEGNLGSGKDIVAGTPAASETEKRLRNTRDALTILTKIREAMRDGSVYVNIGHCHFAREEWDKAIEAYETASKRYYNSQNVSVLLLAARSWFFKAVKDERYASMSNALSYARRALELAPKDDSVRFNIAIIQHRGLEILNALDDEKNEAKLAKRTVSELEQAIAEVEEAQSSFQSLADNQAKNLPYSIELASQRVAFGGTLLRRARESIPRQAEFEQREEAKATDAREARKRVKDAQEEQERTRLAEIALRAAELADARRKQQEEVATWYQARGGGESDEEEAKKKRSRKKKAPAADKKDGSLTPPGSDEEEEKPKRKRPAKKKAAPPKEDDGAGAGPAAANGEDEDEEEVMQRPTKKSRKNFKSAEIIEDSDDD